MLRSRGPGCEVSVLPISGRRPGRGEVIEACLLDAGKKASELELLRSVASVLGVVWGLDDLGAWAMVPNEPQSALVAPPAAEPDLPNALYREDDNGARFLIARFATQAKADELERGGHKQGCFVK